MTRIGEGNEDGDGLNIARFSRSYTLASPSNNQRQQQQRRQQLNVVVNANEWNALCKVSAKRMNKWINGEMSEWQPNGSNTSRTHIRIRSPSRICSRWLFLMSRSRSCSCCCWPQLVRQFTLEIALHPEYGIYKKFTHATIVKRGVSPTIYTSIAFIMPAFWIKKDIHLIT